MELELRPTFPQPSIHSDNIMSVTPPSDWSLRPEPSILPEASIRSDMSVRSDEIIADHLRVQEHLVGCIEHVREHNRQQQSQVRQNHKHQQQSAIYANSLVGEMEKIKQQDEQERRELAHVTRIASKHRDAATQRQERIARERELRQQHRTTAVSNSKLFEQRRQEQQERLRAAHDEIQQSRNSKYVDVKHQRHQLKERLREMRKAEHMMKQEGVQTRRAEKPIVYTRQFEDVLQKVEHRKHRMEERIANSVQAVQTNMDQIRSLEDLKGKMLEKAQNTSSKRQAALDTLVAGCERTDRTTTLMSRKPSGFSDTSSTASMSRKGTGDFGFTPSLSENSSPYGTPKSAPLAVKKNASSEAPFIPKLDFSTPPRSQSVQPEDRRPAPIAESEPRRRARSADVDRCQNAVFAEDAQRHRAYTDGLVQTPTKNICQAVSPQRNSGSPLSRPHQQKRWAHRPFSLRGPAPDELSSDFFEGLPNNVAENFQKDSSPWLDVWLEEEPSPGESPLKFHFKEECPPVCNCWWHRNERGASSAPSTPPTPGPVATRKCNCYRCYARAANKTNGLLPHEGCLAR